MKFNFLPVFFFTFSSLFLGSSLAQTPPAANTDTAQTNPAQTNPTQTNTTQTNQNQSNLTEAQKKEGKIFKLLMVINKNEIDAANLALKKSSNTDVKNFAQTMQTDHTQNLQDTQSLAEKENITPVNSHKSDSLQEKGVLELKKLDAVSGKTFDTDYVNAMVKGHKATLELIKDELLPKASNPEVVNHLKATEKTVSHHLDMAEELQHKV